MKASGGQVLTARHVFTPLGTLLVVLAYALLVSHAVGKWIASEGARTADRDSFQEVQTFRWISWLLKSLVLA